MAIDWEAASAQAEQRKREQWEHTEQLRQQQRAAYLADRERIEREQPEAIKIALRLLEAAPERRHQGIKDAAEAADLETLRSMSVNDLRRQRDYDETLRHR